VKYFLLFLFFVNGMAWGQLSDSIELTEKLGPLPEEVAKKEILQRAILKSIQKFSPELGYKFEDFNEKVQASFKVSFQSYKEKMIVEKFGTNYKTSLSEADIKSFFESLESERAASFIRFTHYQDLLRSHSFSFFKQDEKDASVWKANIQLDFDRIKLDKVLRKFISGEIKPFAKLILISEIDPYQFEWIDLGVDNEKSFLTPLNTSWLKWFNENLPNSVEEVAICDALCMNYFSKWTDTQSDQLSVPEEYNHAVFLKVNLHLKRSAVVENLQEVKFEWEGRALLLDPTTKRVLGSFTLPLESRTFRLMEQKALNSSLASSLYRAPLTAFMQFNRKLEEKVGFTRVSKLVIKGHRNLGDVLLLSEKLKTRGSSLGFEAVLDNFTREEANLLCFYRGEEKSFTDLLSSIKELKSSHGYTLVNEFTGVHHVIKFVTE
jgi:hypothetical protein